MKRIIIILATISFLPFIIQSQIINLSQIEKISIKTIDWTISTFGYHGVCRSCFDKTFEYMQNDSAYMDRYNDFLLSDRNSIILFGSILNKLRPYPISEGELYPNEIKCIDSKLDIPHGIINGYAKNSDPLEVRGKIDIYMRDGTMITAFMSTTKIDINNRRYYSSLLSTTIWNLILFK